MSLFELLTTQVMDDKGFYHGHVVLQNQMLAKKAEFENVFSRMVVSSEISEGLEIFEEIESLAFKSLIRIYFEKQQTLAHQCLYRKRVKVVGGIAKANAEPNNFSVRRVNSPDFFTLKEEEDTLVELAYSSDSLGRILVKEETTIQILGDIPPVRFAC